MQLLILPLLLLPKDHIHAAVTSSTHERKSKTHIIYKNGAYALKHNTFTDDIPVVVLLADSRPS